ncbi:MAG: Mother cell inhibitor of FtsZ [Paenibacillaceae bacterium]|jgi:hypothetical protein|nr:Mother cell inhibitor of FtsZ [Paenibacillaceae bacterium]
MKTYRTPSTLHVVGKAYEIRWQLRKMIRQSSDPHAPLSGQLIESCSNKQAAKHKRNGSSIPTNSL